MKLYSAMFCFFVVILSAPERAVAGSIPFLISAIAQPIAAPATRRGHPEVVILA